MTDKENEIKWRDYFYPGTEILKNNFNIKDYDKLKELDATFSFNRLLELQTKPINMGFGKEHLCAIHKYLFGEVYPFAGKYRNVNLMKKEGTFLTINTAKDVDLYLDELFTEINESLRISNDKYSFSSLLSRLYTQLIYCHPFREGNGRTIREFLREFSKAKSVELGNGEMELDWTQIDKDELNQNIALAHIFPASIATIFEKALVPVNSVTKK